MRFSRFAMTAVLVQSLVFSAQASNRHSEVRDLVVCEFPENDMEIKSVEVFGTIKEQHGQVIVGSVQSIVEVTAHGGFKTIYQGGSLSLGSSKSSGQINIAGQQASLEVDGRSGVMVFNNLKINATGCRSVL